MNEIILKIKTFVKENEVLTIIISFIAGIFFKYSLILLFASFIAVIIIEAVKNFIERKEPEGVYIEIPERGVNGGVERDIRPTIKVSGNKRSRTNNKNSKQKK